MWRPRNTLWASAYSGNPRMGRHWPRPVMRPSSLRFCNGCCVTSITVQRRAELYANTRGPSCSAIRSLIPATRKLLWSSHVVSVVGNAGTMIPAGNG